MFRLSLRRRAAGLFLPLFLVATPVAQAGTLGDTFATLPAPTRVAVQRELARADLYLAEPDGNWSMATERALLRSVDAIKQKSNDRLKPKLVTEAAVTKYLEALGDGTYSRLLYGGNLLQRIFYLAHDPVLDIEG